MPLSMILPGEERVIERISGKDDTKQFLNSLGFVEGNDVTVVSKAAGNIIVGVLDARIAIGRKMANKIFVAEK